MDWVNHTLFPFPVKEFATSVGVMRYVAIGHGPVVLFAHGTPTWSLVWRHAMAKLASHYRVIAVDHLGFGQSDKPADADYSLAGHAQRWSAFIDHLLLREITLVVHDFGGPIALNDVQQRPGLYHKLVLLNTFLWPFADEFRIPRSAQFLQGRIGAYLYLHHNLSPRWLIPAVFANRQHLTPTLHAQYVAPFADASQRQAMWAFVHELSPDNPWLAARWAQRDRLTKLPTLILWGTRDPVFPSRFLQRWQQLFKQAQICTYHDAGHFVQEEASLDYVKQIEWFLLQD